MITYPQMLLQLDGLHRQAYRAFQRAPTAQHEATLKGIENHMKHIRVQIREGKQ